MPTHVVAGGQWAVFRASHEFDLEMRFHPPPPLRPYSHTHICSSITRMYMGRTSGCFRARTRTRTGIRSCGTCADGVGGFTHSLRILFDTEPCMCECGFCMGMPPPKTAHSLTSYPACECSCVFPRISRNYFYYIWWWHSPSPPWQPHLHKIKTICCGQYALTDTHKCMLDSSLRPYS